MLCRASASSCRVPRRSILVFARLFAEPGYLSDPRIWKALRAVRRLVMRRQACGQLSALCSVYSFQPPGRCFWWCGEPPDSVVQGASLWHCCLRSGNPWCSGWLPPVRRVGAVAQRWPASETANGPEPVQQSTAEAEDTVVNRYDRGFDMQPRSRWNAICRGSQRRSPSRCTCHQ